MGTSPKDSIIHHNKYGKKIYIHSAFYFFMRGAMELKSAVLVFLPVQRYDVQSVQPFSLRILLPCCMMPESEVC